MTLIHGSVLQVRSAADCRLLDNTTVTIADNGTIGGISTGQSPSKEARGGDGCYILPGFIDAHLHLPQWDRRGIDQPSLARWRDAIGYPAEARCADPGFAADLAEQFVSGILANGTTTICAFGSPFAAEVDQSFSVFARRGLRAIYGMMLNDNGVPAELAQNPDKALDESRALAAKWHNAENGRLRYAFGPRGTIRCSEKLMRGAAALAEMFNCHLQTHVAESPEEIAEAHEQYPDYVDEVDVYADLGVLTSRTLLAHGMFLHPQQRRQLADRRTALVHCPTANLFRESGLMDYVAHRAAGIRIALGSSIAAGYDPFMPRIAAQTLQTAKAIKVHTLPRQSAQVPPPAEAWWMLTRGGAEALGIADQVGALEVGYQADLLVVRPEKWINNLPADQRLSALLYTLAPEQIEQVYVAGRLVASKKQ